MQTIVNLTRRTLSLPQVLCEILPMHLTDAVSRCSAPRAEELRLHVGRFATVTCNGKNHFTDVCLREDEINSILKRMCKDSLYAYTQHINEGYLSLPGGIRVGVCGNARLENGRVIGVSDVNGLMIRIPHPPRISADTLVQLLKEGQGLGGLLIYAPPGSGKTTLLRALAAEISHGSSGLRTVAVDTREELFPVLAGERNLLDVLVGYPRAIGIEIAVRSMGAEIVICDEIGNEQDADAILMAANCGVPIIATAHASSVRQLLHRPAFARLHDAEVFYAYVGIQRDPREGFLYHVTKREEVSAHDDQAAGGTFAPMDGRICGISRLCP